jgi:hypothetical protein
VISALVAVLLLVLAPGLAYGQSPARLLRSAPTSVRTRSRAAESGRLRVRAEDHPLVAPVLSAQSSVPSRPGGYNPDPKRWKGWAEFKRLGRSMLARGGPAGRSLRAPGFVSAPFRFAASAPGPPAWSTGGAGLHASVLKAVQPWLRGGYLDGSGAGDPADNKHGTFVPVFSLSSPPEFQSSFFSFIGESRSFNGLFSGPFIIPAHPRTALVVQLKCKPPEDPCS